MVVQKDYGKDEISTFRLTTVTLKIAIYLRYGLFHTFKRNKMSMWFYFINLKNSRIFPCWRIFFLETEHRNNLYIGCTSNKHTNQ